MALVAYDKFLLAGFVYIRIKIVITVNITLMGLYDTFGDGKLSKFFETSDDAKECGCGL